MKYYSTRDQKKKLYDSATVIKMGLAPDGGLFIPEEIPSLRKADVDALCQMTYAERAAKILSMFLSDYTYEELLKDCTDAYCEASFPGGAAPLCRVSDTIHSLELWHGPTAAFKDMALQIMPRLLSRALIKTGEENTALILVATSGDTGKAALEGYRDIDRIKIVVFYPVDGVSKVQKLQMATQLGDNVCVYAIKGNFDDAQSGVKKIFADKNAADELLKKSYVLSSANSINWGRLAPQIVYYVSAYCDMLTRGEIAYGDKINVCVPTGNFGNIFAAYLAKRMGLPIDKLVCASNANNVLTDFLRTGTYDRNRSFHMTMSPSMDILISSNLERLLCLSAGEEKTAGFMKALNETGTYTVDSETLAAIHESFIGYCADEEMTAKTLKNVYEKDGYLADTHTAVALCCAKQYIDETGDNTPMIVASTASPYKFAADVYASITGESAASNTEALDQLSSKTGTEIPYPLRGLTERPIRFTATIESDEMLKAVYQFI